jgi:hypothetical protein
MQFNSILICALRNLLISKQARFNAEDIYTNIGDVLVALNPYELLHKVFVVCSIAVHNMVLIE